MISVLVLLMLASGAYAAGSGESSVLDIIGSNAGDTRITSSGMGPVDVEIIGSTANNIQIGPSVEQANATCSSCNYCDYSGDECCYSNPWSDFTRPLCYPWSSYIPTRYNRPFYTKAYGYSGYPVAYLGQYYQNFQ